MTAEATNQRPQPINMALSKALFDFIVFSPVHIVRGTYQETTTSISFTASNGILKAEYIIQKKNLKTEIEAVKNSINENLFKSRR